MHTRPAISSTAIPGVPISNYRNSTRRAIRLIRLGATASDIDENKNDRGRRLVAPPPALSDLTLAPVSPAPSSPAPASSGFPAAARP